VGELLIAQGKLNKMPYLKIRAKVQASTDSLSTPVFDGWSMEFNCVPDD
jgi:hypothetical protein